MWTYTVTNRLGEYVVRFYSGSVFIAAATYYTPDKRDAEQTGRLQCHKNNKASGYPTVPKRS